MKELMKRQQKAALKRAQERRNVTDIYEENIDIFTESMMGGKMALNISSSQIYAGRYHYKDRKYQIGWIRRNTRQVHLENQ